MNEGPEGSPEFIGGARGRAPIPGMKASGSGILSHYPPILTGKEEGEMDKEIQGYVAVMKELWDQVKGMLDGVPQEALEWRPLRGEGDLATNSLAAMAAHLAGSGTYLIKEVVGRQPIQRDREGEFATQGVNASTLKGRLDAAAATIEKILSALNAAQMEEDRKYRDRTAKVRWIILHVIEHTAIHVGHMQLTRQMWLARDRK